MDKFDVQPEAALIDGKFIPELSCDAQAVVKGDAMGGLMASGQVAGRLEDLPDCDELMDRIEHEARVQIAAISGTSYNFEEAN